ncbi:MAG: amino acid permease [Candidatus Aceula meridiana]|nr:amino acid permease [Candidatus Aceula meridiana]
MSSKRFGTFEGVFIPSLLSIFGVIMYLRLSWVVGSVGIAAAISIIALSNFISLSTGLSVSSIVTNIRIGHGGAYSIITKSLGLEAGGAIGLPLYLAQAISVAFYIVGFAECWKYVFPMHSFLLVCLIAWIGVLMVSYYSARLAFRIQYVVLVIVGLSFISIFLGKTSGAAPAQDFSAVAVSSGSFFEAFAVFFPAVTGFMAGLSMSGELNEPKKNIPNGTLAAVGVSIIAYVALAFWFAKSATPQALVNNTNIVIDMGRWPSFVIAGIMGATLSSALNMCVTAPRTLFALSQSDTLPLSRFFVHRNQRNEPTAAILLTALIALITLLMGTLNQVATLLTMFFLITYGLINFSVFVEQTIGITSFRPSFNVPRIISFLGWVGCLVVMFLINPMFSLVAWLVIILLYIGLIRRETERYSPDVRSGLLIFLSEQMAKAAAKLPYYPKIWKPNVVVAVEDIKNFAKAFGVLLAIVSPSGRLAVFRIVPKVTESLSKELNESIEEFKQEGIFSEAINVEGADSLKGVKTILQTLKGTHFPPNILFYILPKDEARDQSIIEMIKQTCLEKLGIVILQQGKAELSDDLKQINLWIRKGSPNLDLSILTAIQLQKNWDGRIRLVQIVDVKEEIDESVAYLSRLGDLMRFPADVDIQVLVGKFPDVLMQAPKADIDIFGMPEVPDIGLIRKISQEIETSVLFLRDSHHESAVA